MRNRIVLSVILSLFTLTGHPQVDTSGCKYKKPILLGHPYHLSDRVSSPFIKTYLFGSIGLGTTSMMNVPGLEVGGREILAFTGQLMFLSANLQYQQKVNDWLAIFFNYKLVGRVGSDVGMILVDGFNSLSGADLGWLFRLYHNERFQLSGTMFLQNMSGSFVDIVGYINDLLDSVPNPKATKNIPVMNGGLGFNGAWTLNETVGLLFETRFLYGESFVRGVHSFFMGLGVAVDLDFNPKYGVPVGVNAGYAYSSEPENTLLEFNNTNILDVRIAYTGSCDFDVGLQFSFYRYELQNIEVRRPWVMNTALGFNMYF